MTSPPIGSFLIDRDSSRPVVLISCMDNENGSKSLLLSKVEFGGDYYWKSCEPMLQLAEIDIFEKISIIGQFGGWFLNRHRDIVHEIMIEFAMYISMYNQKKN